MRESLDESSLPYKVDLVRAAHLAPQYLPQALRERVELLASSPPNDDR